MASESEIEREVMRHAMQTGWLQRKLRFINVNGAPDRLLIYKGSHIYIEFKALNGTLSPSQHLEIKRLRDSGANVFVVDNVVEGKKILDDARKTINSKRS